MSPSNQEGRHLSRMHSLGSVCNREHPSIGGGRIISAIGELLDAVRSSVRAKLLS